MADDPKTYTSIMVSSTFSDLEGHRQEVIDAINRLGFKAEVMEHSGANSGADVIDTSLQMVRNCSAYVLVISHKYGQTPKDPRNPDGLSITELEFDEAVKLGRPRLLFLMSVDHPVTVAAVEDDPDKKEKLAAFKERAKSMCPAASASDAQCVYEMFASKEQLGKQAAIAIANMTGRPASTFSVETRGSLTLKRGQVQRVEESKGLADQSNVEDKISIRGGRPYSEQDFVNYRDGYEKLITLARRIDSNINNHEDAFHAIGLLVDEISFLIESR